MNSKATSQFWQLLAGLPEPIQRRARCSYELWRDNPRHPGVRFKRVDEKRPLYSARVNDDYRALGILRGDTVTWFWIGKHAEYTQIIK